MTFSRKILIGIICASCVFATYYPAQADNRIQTTATNKKKIQGTVSTFEAACAGKQADAKCDINDGSPNSKNIYYPSTDPKYAPTCQVISGNTLSCYSKKCKPEIKVVGNKKMAEDRYALSTKTYTCRDIKKTCPSGKKLHTWMGKNKRYPNLDETVLLTDDTCLAKSCIEAEMRKLYAVKWDTPAKNCKILECESGYYLDTAKDKCIKCRACAPTNANCELKSSNVKGQQGVEQCTYDTSCKSGFEDEQNHGKYNPSCSATANTNTITYELQGGEWSNGLSGPSSYNPDTGIPLSVRPVQKGYIFDGWCSGPDTCETSIYEIKSGTTGPVTVYATWIKEPDSDITIPVQQEVNDTEIANILKPKAEEEDKTEKCVFSGANRQYVTDTTWLKAERKCIPTACTDNAHLENEGKVNAVCIVGKAPEEENVRTINVKFEQNGGTGCEDKRIVKTDASETVIDCKPSQDNMVFDGWCLNAGLTNCSATQTLSATDSGDKIFYAKWRKAETTEPTPKKQATCKSGYKLVDGKCVSDGIDKAQEAYDAAKEKEQSLENRMLGGATMAATGIGGMELARGLAEQKADKAADADMTAYLSTFQCKVGDRRYSGGDSQIEIPGGNELINLYQEYVNLANDLKERKAALGKKAGIESEVVLDKANMGLYDETGKGIENGTYASLYRASKGNETDTQKIDDTKSASKKRVIAGAVVGGAGAVGGMVGNSAINGKLGEAIQGLKDNSSFDLGSFDLDSETVSKLQNVFGNNLNGDIFSKLQGAFGDKLQNLDSGTLSKLTSAFGNKLQNVDGDTLNQLQSEYGSDLNNMSKADILKAARNIKAKN